jgi:poly-gamma-glutamate synthesis protein (capsule biosynthesis protein)
VLFDLGDFLDDYRVDRRLRNDLSILWLVTLDERGPQRVEGLPVRLEYAHTRPADSGEARQLLRLLDERCAATGSRAELVGRRVVFVDVDGLSR